MGQRQATVELTLLEYIVLSGSNRHWRFKTKPNAPFDQLIDGLIKVRLYQIREVYFTLTSGDYSKQHAFEIHDDGMWFLSHFFANWEEMFEQAKVHTSRTYSLPQCSRCGRKCVTECAHCNKPFCEGCYSRHEYERRQQREQATFSFHWTDGGFDLNGFFRDAFQRQSTQGTSAHAFTQVPGVPADVRKAHTLLGITRDKPTEEEIRKAFRTKVKAIHPDSGGRGGDLDNLTKAKECALKFAGVE